MNRVALAFVLWGASIPATAQPAKESTANVTVVAKVTGVGSAQINKESYGLLTLELGKDVTGFAYVPKKTADELIAGDKKRLAALEKRGDVLQKELDKLLEDFVQEKDKEKLKKIAARLDELNKELLQNIEELTGAVTGIGTVVVAEGTLTLKGRKLTLNGTARPRDPDKDKVLPAGSVVVVGELQAGEFKAGETKATHAIQNGAAPIPLTGKGAKAAAELKGTVRAAGKWAVGDKETIVFDVVKVEAVKK